MSSKWPAIHWPTPPIDDGVVSLSEFRHEDIEVMVGVSSDPAIRQWTSWPHHYTEVEAAAGIERRERDRLSGQAISFALRQKPGGQLCGGVDLRAIDRAVGVYEVAYWVAPECRGRSLASHGLQLVCDWAGRELSASCFEALIQPDNASSIRVVEQLGFQRGALLEAHRVRSGQPLDFFQYRLWMPLAEASASRG
ncbi:GNAT family N-acetyltransferase [Streptomyces sp. NPDC048521]|uniref:GNAT family N-acetyltransferase n=1 Tax=Streptomyces sp. NPDC048521 TaxID=3365566 RepID=UPI003711CA1B